MATGRTAGRDPAELTDQTIELLESARAEGYERAVKSHGIMVLQLKAESDRLQRKYGKEHPRIKKITASLGSLELTVAGVELNSHVIKSQVPLDETSWNVQGFITDKGHQPVKEFKVLLQSSSSNERNEKGKTSLHRVTETNDIGFYSFTLTKEEIESLNGEKVLISLTDDKPGKSANFMAKEFSPAASVVELYDISLP